jgi:PTH1 family peptidyl-tRNA hydrolase
MDYLFVGLGNPGTEYQINRHNVGFLSLDFMQKNLFANENFKNVNKFFSETFTVTTQGKKVIFAKPQTFMNDSGKSVIAINNFYKVQNTVVIHDDLDIEFGAIKLSKGNSEAGHNGLKSISSNIGNANYAKIRIGISRPKYNSKDYVLANFTGSQQKDLEKNIFPAVQNIVIDIIKDGFTKAQNKWN